MMNTIRNILIVVAVIAIGYIAVSFIANIVPILITAVAAFVLGRLSVHFDLLNFIRNLRTSGQAVQAAAATTAAAPVIAAASKPAPIKTAPAKVEQAAERLADEPKNDSILLDPNFEIKTSEQIEAESRLREQEALKKASKRKIWHISGFTGDGVKPLLREMLKLIEKSREEAK